MRLEKFLDINKLSIEEFAQAIKVHPFTVRRYLNGRRPKREISLRIRKITNDQVTANDWEDDEECSFNCIEPPMAILR